MADMIVRDSLVAVKHHNTNPVTIKIQRDGTNYSFVPKTNVSMCWIKEEHLSDILALKAKGCCGKKKRVKFLLANELDVCLWETGTRCK